MVAALALLALPLAAALDAARPQPAHPWTAADAPVGQSAGHSTIDAPRATVDPHPTRDAAPADDPGVGSRPDPALELVRRGAAFSGVDRDPTASGLRRGAGVRLLGRAAQAPAGVAASILPARPLWLLFGQLRLGGG